ncbi:MAG: hypothetical protein ACPGUV_05895 [Polyangiales bacterium]
MDPRHPAVITAQTGNAFAPYTILPAVVPDDRPRTMHAPIAARRVIYRVRLRPGARFRRPRDKARTPTAELSFDVTDARLRAHFLASGWPVAAGTQVRLRTDVAGTYVFDRHGGRPLAAGRLATWFEGTERPAKATRWSVRPSPRSEGRGPGTLICAFLAEWAGEPGQPAQSRCGSGGSPVRFRVGPWFAERTADVPMQLSWEALRADHSAPPVPPRAAAALEDTADAALATATILPVKLRRGRTGRHLLLIDGLPCVWGWGKRSLSQPMPVTTGYHRIGVLSPLGRVLLTPRDLHLRAPRRLAVVVPPAPSHGSPP